MIKQVKTAAAGVQALNDLADKAAIGKSASTKVQKKTAKTKKAENFDIQTYIWNSINTYSNLIEFQAASKLASQSLLLAGAKKSDRKWFSKWLKLYNFDMKHFTLEKRLAGDGVFAIALRKYGKNKVMPALARITSEPKHASNTSQTITLSVESTDISGVTYDLQETHTYNAETKKWLVKRAYVTGVTRKGVSKEVPIDGIAFNLKQEETSDSPLFFVFENNLERKGDYDNALLKMIDHGKFMYWLYKKFGYLSPKIFNKVSVSGKKRDTFDRELEEETYIDIESRAGQFQQPVTVFNPTLPNATIIETVKFLEDQIFMSSLSSRLTDGGKQAQQNDLEQALKNEMANNYIEFKKKLRQQQFTAFFRAVAAIEGRDLSDAIVQISLSSTQTRLLEGDGKAGK